MKAGTNRMVKDTFELTKERHLKKEWELKEKMDEARRNWEKVLLDASAFFQEQKIVGKWTVKEHGPVLKSLRNDKN